MLRLILTDDGRLQVDGPTLEMIATQLTGLILRGDTMSAQLDALTREVAETRTVVDSAVTLIGSLAGQIEALKNDPVALQALADDLNAQQGALAAAVAAVPPPPTP